MITSVPLLAALLLSQPQPPPPIDICAALAAWAPGRMPVSQPAHSSPVYPSRVYDLRDTILLWAPGSARESVP